MSTLQAKSSKEDYRKHEFLKNLYNRVLDTGCQGVCARKDKL